MTAKRNFTVALGEPAEQVNYDATLLQRWYDLKDPQAFDELMRRHAGFVFNYLYEHINPRDAADILQETFIKLMRSKGSKLDQACRESAWKGIRGWLINVASHRAIDFNRSAVRQPTPEQELADGVPVHDDHDTNMKTAALADCIAALPEHLKQAVVLHYFEEWSKVDIGDACGVTPTAIAKRIKTALPKLADCIESKIGISS